MARLKAPVKLSELLSQGAMFEIDTSQFRGDSDDDGPDTQDILSAMLENTNLECAGIFDEDTYEEGNPFDVIAKKMFNLIPDGKIKKRILREGVGEKPNKMAQVKIHYNAYLEFDEKPFDSTYARNSPRFFVVDDGQVIAGLDFGVQTMRLNEKAQFLIDSEHAYKNCLIGRIPPNATVLFEVELIEIVDSGAALTFEQLPEERQQLFSEVYKYAMALAEKGKSAFANNNLKDAIKNYNMAACKLEKVALNNMEENEKHRELALRLYTNLLICYTRNSEPRKACTNAQKIYDLTEDGKLLKISAKAYFNHAKSLRILGDYDRAKSFLDKALKIEPKNPEIANEVICLEKDKTEHRNKQMVFAKALVGKKK